MDFYRIFSCFLPQKRFCIPFRTIMINNFCSFYLNQKDSWEMSWMSILMLAVAIKIIFIFLDALWSSFSPLALSHLLATSTVKSLCGYRNNNTSPVQSVWDALNRLKEQLHSIIEAIIVCFKGFKRNTCLILLKSKKN